MKKYAIVPISMKSTLPWNLYIRCVLIEYTHMNKNFFKGTRYIDCSPYFKDGEVQLHYKFEDDGFILVKDDQEVNNKVIEIKREYHLCSSTSIIDSRLTGVRFTCENDEQAIAYFKNSEFYDTETHPLQFKRI